MAVPRAFLQLFSGSALTAALLFSAGAEARTAEPDLQTRSAARDLAGQGVDAFEAEDYATALDRFNRAAELFPAPSISVMKARCLVKLNRWLEALDTYVTVSSAPVSADAPEAFRRARSDALHESSELRANMPRLNIQSHRPESDGDALEVKLDGRVVPAALLDVEQPIDPGVHTVLAASDGTVLFQRNVTLAPKQRTSVAITPGSLEPPANPGSEAPTPSTQFPSSRRVWTYVAFGVGGLGLTVAAVSGSIALDQQATLDACEPRCPRDTDDDRASLSTNRALAFTGLALGAAGVGLGVYLLLAGKSDSSHVAAQLTPTGARLVGSF